MGLGVANASLMGGFPVTDVILLVFLPMSAVNFKSLACVIPSYSLLHDLRWCAEELISRCTESMGSLRIAIYIYMISWHTKHRVPHSSSLCRSSHGHRVRNLADELITNALNCHKMG